MNIFEKNEYMLVPRGFYNAQGQEMTSKAFYALKAAMMARQIGRYAAIRYALNNGSTYSLFRLAQQLHATNKVDKAERI